MQRIVVLNPKGGSGKTTLAINLAAYFAARGDNTLLIDRDPQGSATRWLRKRKVPQPAINGIATFEHDARTTRAWQMRVPEGTREDRRGQPRRRRSARPARAHARCRTRSSCRCCRRTSTSTPPRAASPTCCWSPRSSAPRTASASSPIACARTRLMFQSLMRFLEKLDIPDRRDHARLAELRACRRTGRRHPRNEALPRSRKTWRSGKRCWPGSSRNGCWPNSPRRCRNSPRPEAVPTA